jgi:hypothetical protein
MNMDEHHPPSTPGERDQANPAVPGVRIGRWKTVAAEGGGSVSLDGDRLAVADEARLVVWRGRQRLAAAVAPWPAPGRACFLGDRVLWGPGVLHLPSGHYAVLAAARPEIWPGGGERPHVHAWSARGERLLVSYSTGDSARPTRIALFGGHDERAVATRWYDNYLPPQAAWVGSDVAVIGFRNLEVLDAASGAERGRIALDAGTVVRLDADARERRLMAVDLNRAIIWIDLRTGTVIGRWEGRWLDAAIAPDGSLIVAVDLAGRLHFARPAEGRCLLLGTAAAITRPGSVALDRGLLAVVGGGIALRTTLAIRG